MENGFYPTTLEQVASKASVSKGTISLHFGSKNELALGILEEARADLIQSLELNLNAHTRPEDQLKAAIRAFLEWCCEHPYQARYIYSLPHREFGKKDASAPDPILKVIRKVIIEGQRSGAIRAGRPFLLTVAACGPVVGLCQLVLESRINYDLREFSDQMAGLAWDMISNKAGQHDNTSVFEENSSLAL